MHDKFKNGKAQLREELLKRKRLGLDHFRPIGKIQSGSFINKRYVLEKMGEEYFLRNLTTTEVIKIRDESLLFVITVNEPDKIICSIEDIGHTLLSVMGNVIYAGQIYFIDGKLIEWNNLSGHYKPQGGALRHSMFYYSVRRILKSELFRLYCS